MLAALGVFCPVLNLTAKNVGIKLVCFHVDRLNIADSGIMESGALLANGFDDAQNCFLFEAGQTANGTDADALTKQPDNFIDLLGFNSQAVQRLRL